MSEFTEDDADVLDDMIMWVRTRPSAPWHFIDCPEGPAHEEASHHRRLGEGPPPKGERSHFQCVYGPQYTSDERKAARAAGKR